MSAPRLKAAIATIGIAVVAIALFGVVSSFTAALSFFEKNLAGDRDVRVMVHGTPYTVASGAVAGTENPLLRFQILRIAYLRLLAERSPLFALPETDLQRFRSALDEMRRTQDILAEAQQSPEDRRIVETSLYPMDFLAAISAAERARRDFVAEPSDERAAAYRRAQWKALRGYIRDLARFEAGFKKAVPEGMSAYATAGDYVTRDNSLRTITDTRKGVYEVARELRSESFCFAGIFSRCLKPAPLAFAAARTNVPLTREESAQVDAIRTILYEASLERDSLWKTGADPYGLAEIDILDRPVLILNGSACNENMPGPPAFKIRDVRTGSGSVYLAPVQLGNLRFTDAAEQSEVKFYKYFADHGIRYVFNPSLNHYVCGASGAEAMRLFGMQNVVALAAETPLSGFAHGTAKTALLTLERAFADPASAVSEADIEEYLATAAPLLASSALPPETERRLIERMLALKYDSTGAENTLLWIADIEQRNAGLQREGIQVSHDLPYLFYVRSGFLSTFFTANPSVTRLAERPYEATAIPVAQQPFVYFSQLPHTPAMEKELVRSIRFYSQLHADAATFLRQP